MSLPRQVLWGRSVDNLEGVAELIDAPILPKRNEGIGALGT